MFTIYLAESNLPSVHFAKVFHLILYSEALFPEVIFLYLLFVPIFPLHLKAFAPSLPAKFQIDYFFHLICHKIISVLALPIIYCITNNTASIIYTHIYQTEHATPNVI